MKKPEFYFSLAGSALIIAFLISVNLLYSPDIPWVLFTLLPAIWWPVTVLFINQAASLVFALASYATAILYYGFINILFLNGHPWVVYIAYALLWWPLTLFFVKRKQPFQFSIAGAFISIVFFIAVNFITTPHEIWFIYPVFLILWWPLSVYFFVYKAA